MNSLLVIFFLLVISLSMTCMCVPTPSIPQNIFLLAGQSNMAGRGLINVTNTPPECLPHPDILRLTAKLKWEEARDPLHRDIDTGNKTNGVGPGMPFANTVLADKPDFGTIGLVPCAIGGSSLSQWVKGTQYYNALVSRARASGGRIRALLWYQGEFEAGDPNLGATYGVRFIQFVSDLRTDLGIPDLPVIQVALDEKPNTPDSLVRKFQLSCNYPGVKTVDAKGLPLLQDEVHLTTKSQIILGKMMATFFSNTFLPNTTHQ